MSHITQSNRAMAGFLKRHFRSLALDRVDDPRRKASTRWRIETLLTTLLVGIAASCRSLKQVEQLTETGISGAMRGLLRLHRRVSDTTLRDFLCKLTPESLRPLLHQVTRDAYRRKALTPEGLPFGVVALDGKVTAVGRVTDDSEFAQHVKREDGKAQTHLRTITACLVSAAARPVIDVTFLPGSTNEMGHFDSAFDALMSTYGRTKLFQVVSYDAGATSKANAEQVIAAGKDYLFALKTPQQELWNEYVPQLEARLREDGETVDIVSNKTVTRRVYLYDAPDGSPEWEHLRTVLRVEATVEDQEGNELSCESRYFLSSLSTRRLTAKQWLQLVRAHWGVENNAHHALDVQFEEDDHLFVPTHVGASLCLIVLRRVVLSLLALFRSVSLKSQDKREMPWKTLLHWVARTLVSASKLQVDGLRRRREVALATS